MAFTPHFWTSLVGSVPYSNGPDDISKWLVDGLDVPNWPQLPRRNFRESMYVQYSRALPSVCFDEVKEKVFFNIEEDLSNQLENFYTNYLADDLDAFGLTPDYASGFFAMLKALEDQPVRDIPWVKGQVTGPISFGLTVTDQNLRASLYNEFLADVIVKNAAMNARWQIRLLKRVRPEVILFVDEPYLASFGSAFISLQREQVIDMLNEVFDAIHSEGAISGVHCCANTDWSVLLATRVNVLNLDAYGFIENLALYPKELKTFLERGGVIAWGAVPNNEMIFSSTPSGLAQQLLEGFKHIQHKAELRGVDIPVSSFTERSLLLPSCGLGAATPEIANRVLRLLKDTGELLKAELPAG